MSHLPSSRFDLSFPESDKIQQPPLPPGEDGLEQLAADICQLDPEFAEILFESTFSTKTREEKVARIRQWADA